MFGNQKLNGSKVPAFWRSNSDFAPPFLDTGELLAWYRGGTQEDGYTLIDKKDPPYADPTVLTSVNAVHTGPAASTYLDTGVQLIGDFTLEVTVTDCVQVNGNLLGNRNSTGGVGLMIDVVSPFLRLYVDSDTDAPVVWNKTLADLGSTFDVKIVRSGSDMTLYYDGVALGTQTVNGSLGDKTVLIGASWNNTAPTGIKEAKFTNLKITKPASQNIELVVFGGQSNMVGSSSGSLPTDLANWIPDDSYRYWYDVNTTYDENDVALDETPNWSGELQAGYLMEQNYGEKLRAFVKVAYNGTNLLAWQEGQTAYESMVLKINTAVATLESEGYNVTVSHLVWIQGESDCESEALANTYYENFMAMLYSYQENTAITADTKVIISRIGLGTGYPYIPPVRSDQERIGAELGAWIDTDDYPKAPDDLVHYNADGKIMMGNDIYANIADYVEQDVIATQLPMQEGYGGKCYDVSTTRQSGTLINPAWDVASQTYSANASRGFSILPTFDGATNIVYGAHTLDTVGWTIELECYATAALGKVFYGAGGLNIAQFEFQGSIKDTSVMFRDASGNSVVQQMDISDPTVMHTFKIVRNGDTLNYYIDGNHHAEADASGLGEVGIPALYVGSTNAAGSYFAGQIRSLYISDYIDVKFNEGSGTDVGGGTLDTGDEDAFWGAKIPATLKGGVDADVGSALTNPAGYPHNGSEVSIDFADTLAITVDPSDYQDLLDHVQSSDHMYLKWRKVNGNCMTYEILCYNPTWWATATEAEKEEIILYCGLTEC